MSFFRNPFNNKHTLPSGTTINGSGRQGRLAKSRLRSLFIVIPLLLAGCTNPLGPLPSKAEIGSLPIPELKQRYPFLCELEPRTFDPYSSGTIDKGYTDPRFAIPAAAGLIDKWGEPDYAVLSWWSLKSLCTIVRHHRWYWYVNDKEVDAFIVRPIFNGFTPELVSMTIRPKKQTTERNGK